MAELQVRSARWGAPLEALRCGFGRWQAPVTALALAVLTSLSFGGSLHNKPAAEDFIPPGDFVQLGGEQPFRPFFALVMQVTAMLAGAPADQPAAYHVVSIAIHVSVVVLLFTLSRLLTGSVGSATALALIFALYPRHHETVLWPAASVHALMALWVLASFVAYLHAKRTQRQSWRLLSVVFFSLGLLSSEDGATGLALLLVYELLWRPDVYRSRAILQTVRQLARQLWPFATVIGIYAGLLVLGSNGVRRFVGARDDIKSYHLSFGPETVKDFAGYLTYTVFPFVPLRELHSTSAKFLLMLAALVLLIGGFAYGTRLVRFGISWIAITVLPYVLLVPFGNADRYFYLPAIGFGFLVVGLGQQWLARVLHSDNVHSEQLVATVLAICLALYCIVTIIALQARIQEWSVAGKLAASILDQTQQRYPDLNAQTTIYFVDLPDKYKQARVLGVGVTPAVQQRYQRTLTVKASIDPELRAALLATPGGRRTGSGPIILFYHDGTLVDYSASFSDARIQALLLTHAH